MSVGRVGGGRADVLHGRQPGGDGHGMVAGDSDRVGGEFGGSGAHGVEWACGDQIWCAVPRAGARLVRDPRCECAVAAARARGVWVVRDPDVDRRASHLPAAQHVVPWELPG